MKHIETMSQLLLQLLKLYQLLQSDKELKKEKIVNERDFNVFVKKSIENVLQIFTMMN